MARLQDIYGSTAQAATQPTQSPMSPDRDTAPKPMPKTDYSVPISLLGLVLALVALRVVYELSE